MKIVKLLVIFSSLIVSSSWVNAQGNSSVDKRLAAAERTNYEQSPQLPDGIAFVTTMRMIKAMQSESPEVILALIESEMGLDTVAAQELADSLLSALEKFDSDEGATAREVVCEYGVPRAVGVPAFALLRSMDDARDELADRHLAAFRKSLDSDTDSKFQLWLEIRKLNIVHVTYDHKKLAQLHGRDNLDGQIAGLCNMLERERVARGVSK